MHEFAKRLKYERKFQSWSQEHIARLIGTTSPNVSRWERGKTFPSLYYRQKLCELFGKSAEDLGLLQVSIEKESTVFVEKEEKEEEHCPSASTSPRTNTLLCNFPYPQNPFFTGREKMLKRLHTTFHSNNIFKSLAICGLGGIGKTQVALEYAYRYASEYQTILWLQANTPDTFILEIAIVAQTLKLIEPGEQNEHLTTEAVRNWLNQHNDWLVVVDNVEEFAMLCKFLPLQTNGHVLITTRSQSPGPLVQRMDLARMEPDEGVLFLLRRARYLTLEEILEHASLADRHLATELFHFMDGLPLALDQAGAYIEESACCLSHYLELLQKSRVALLNLRNLSNTFTTDHPHSVSTTLSLSFDYIKQVQPAAIELLKFCTSLDTDSIPEKMLTEAGTDLHPLLLDLVANPLKLDAAIAELRRHSLLQRNAVSKTLSVPRLIRTVLNESKSEPLQL